MTLLMMLLTTATAWGWSGSGTSADPYQIATANDLIQLATNVNNGTDYSGKYFKQTVPITLTSAWTPIGTSSKPFKGKYDGDNKTISGLTVSGSYQYAGLFGYTCGSSSSLSSCTLKNIIVTDCNIDVSGTNESYAGGIVGYASDDTQIRNCRVSGTVKAKTNAGGIVGILWTTPGGHIAQMIECFADVTVSTATYKGKLIGRGSTTIGAYANSVFNEKISYYHADGSGVTAFGEGDDVTYSVPLYTVSGVPSGLTLATTNAMLTFNDTPYFASGATTSLTVDDANKVFNTFSVSGATSSLTADKRSATITLGSSDATVSATLTEVHTVTPASGLQVTSDAYFTYSNSKYYKVGNAVTVAPTSQYDIVEGTSGTGSATATVAADKRSFSFTMPAEDVSPTATTSEVHTVTPASGLRVTSDAYFTYSNTKYYKVGNSVTVAPTSQYDIIDGTGGTGSATATIAADKRSFSFTMPAEDVSPTATLTEVHTVTPANGVTIQTEMAANLGFSYGGKNYWRTGVELTLSGLPTDDPGQGYQYAYTANGIAISGTTLTVGNKDITVSYALQPIDWATESTGDDLDHAYVIYNKDQLDLLAQRVNSGNAYSGKYFVLGANIKYSHTTDWNDENSTENNYTPIGGESVKFKGHFDGQGHTISGIRIYKSGTTGDVSYQGLFSRTDGADIRGITLVDARITGYTYTGGIVGCNCGTVTNCHVAADVTIHDVWSSDSHGGIVGHNYGTVSDCTSAVTLTAGTMDFGGIAGRNDGGTLSHNFSIGAVVPAAKYNSHGAICGRNGYFNNRPGILENNYYYGCKVPSNNVTATGVGCGYINNSTTADVTNNNGAVPAYLVTLNDGVTIQTAMAADLGYSYGGKSYWREGVELTLVLPDLPNDVPTGYLRYAYTANGKEISGSTLTVGHEDITVKRTLIVDPAVGKLLTLATNGDGTVTIDECAGMTDNGDGTYTVLPGTTISVKATPAADSYFKNWNTETDINSNVAVTSTFTVNEDMTLTAHFVAKPVLTLTADGNGTVDIQGFTYGNKTIIPSSSITVQSESSSYDGEKGDKLFDGIYTGNNKWCSVADPKFVEFKTSSAVQVNGYTLITGNDNSSNPGRNPKSWVLKANLDGSDNWTTIASVSNDNTMMDVDYTPFDFQMDVPGTYRYFRLEVSEVHNNDLILQLGELQLFYQEITPVEGVTQGATANTYILDYGTAITVKAKPAEGKCVRNWDNDDPIIPAKAATLTKTYTLTENTTATAHFASYHTLTPGADLTVNGVPVSQGSTITVPTGATVVLTHDHVGYTAHYTVNTTAIDGSTFIMPDENVTVSATWTMTTYTITYELNGGDVATANPTSYNIETETFTLNNPTKPGYTFTGWTGSNGDTPETTVTITKGTMTEDLNYTANFEFIRFTEGDLSYEWTSATSVKVTACNNSATSVTIPATVSNLGVTYNVTAISNQVFYNCPSLESISVAEGNTVYHSEGNCIIETASHTLIQGCKNSVIPDGVTTIGDYAFKACTGLTSITIPANVTSIGYAAFTSCSGLESISVAAGNPKFHSEGNCLIETASHTLIQGCKNSVIPDDVTTIGGGAFANCTSVTSIEIPASVTHIGDFAFSGCTSLTSIEIPASVTSIGDYAFSGCPGLTSVTIYAPSLSYYGADSFVNHASGRKIYVFNSCVNTYKGYASRMNFNKNDVQPIAGISLKDAADNSSLVAAAHGNELDVTLQGRKLTANNWNTLCLPFDLSCAQIESLFGSGTQVKTLSSYSNDGTTVTITYEDATTIEAGKPYIVKPTNTVTDPVFSDVTISNTMNDVTKGDATFKGTYGPVALTANDKQRLFLANNTLWYPTANLTVRSCRAYFELDADVPETAGAPSIVIEYGEATSLTPAPSPTGEGSGYWFTLDGRKLDKKPTTKGMYIHNGHKVVIK